MRTPSSLPGARPAGFTLIELLVVIGIVAVLSAILLPVMATAKKKTKIAVAKMDIHTLQMAISTYRATYQFQPVSQPALDSSGANTASADFTYGTTRADGTLLNPKYPRIQSYGSPSYRNCNAELMALIRPSNFTGAPGQPVIPATGTPQTRDFIQVRATSSASSPGLGPDGVFRDPWGNPYIITLDLDYNEECIDGFYGALRKKQKPSLPAPIKGDALIWSFGPDGKVSTTTLQAENKDNIVSW